VARLVPEAAGALGPLGVLVNNASAFERDEWDSVTRESWDAHRQSAQSLRRSAPIPSRWRSPATA